MVDSVEIKTEETTSEKPVEEKQSTQSVQGLPEKFKSVEDLAKSYSELEKKLGEQTPKEETVDPVSATKLKEEAPKQENSLMSQIWVMDTKKKVSDIINELNFPALKVKDFFRLKIGD